MSKPSNPYAETYRHFLKQTKDHELRVLHDDGLYRHLRVQKPVTCMWSWDIVTWPGYLATVGDVADGYTFTRDEDMLHFFTGAGRREDHYSDGAPSIDFRYWAEKLCGGRALDVKTYSRETFLQQVREHLEEHEDLGTDLDLIHDDRLALVRRIHKLRGLDAHASQTLLEAHWETDVAETHKSFFSLIGAERQLDEARAALAALWSTESIDDDALNDLVDSHAYYELGDEYVPRLSPGQRRAEILDEARWHADSEEEAHAWLKENVEIFGQDTWEWDLRDYDVHFLYTCYAIVLTTRLWREHQEGKA